ncbi:MAG: nuclear transport factor 2 family protein [Actinomycetota bacterium]
MASKDLQDQWRAAVDRQAIVELTHAYCWALDDKDYEALRSVFAVDATAELGSGGQTGIDEIIGRVSSALAQFVTTQHLVGSHLIELDGDDATGRCYLQAQQVTAPGDGADQPTHYLVGATYRDRYRRTDVGWRIVERAIIPTWSQFTARPKDGRPSL